MRYFDNSDFLDTATVDIKKKINGKIFTINEDTFYYLRALVAEDKIHQFYFNSSNGWEKVRKDGVLSSEVKQFRQTFVYLARMLKAKSKIR